MAKNSNKKTKVDPVIQSARRRQRQSLARERAAADRHADEIARRTLYEIFNGSTKQRMTKDEAIVFATTKLAKAVADSMNVCVPVTAGSSMNTAASTDFKSIHIEVQRGYYDLNDPESIKRLIHFVKGLVYHEVGHIKYTLPITNLWETVNSLNAHISETYVSDYLSSNDISWDKFKRSWNWLEDQRMECAMVRYSPILRSYFTTIVLDFVATVPEFGWPLVAGRSYLSKDILDMFRASGHMLTHKNDPYLIKDTSSVVAKYKRATDVTEVFHLVCEYVDIIDRWMDNAIGRRRGPNPTPGQHHENRKRDDDYQKILDDSADPNAEEPDSGSDASGSEGDTKGQATTTDGDNKDGDGKDSKPNGDDAGGNTNIRSNEDMGAVPQGTRDRDDNSRGTSHTPNADHSDAQPPSESDIEKSIQNAKNEIIKNTPVSDYEAKEFIASVNTELNMDIRHNVHTTVLGEQDLVSVDEVHRGIMSALEILAVQVDPGWRFNQEDGILDPTAFMMRDPGETNYWAHLDDMGNQGFDLSVSVLLDVSYSMHDVWCRDNGISTLGIRRACDEMGIPCTVSTFSDFAETLWLADEEPDPVFAFPTGGTNIYQNLQALDDQRYGKTRQLVVILTDGQWSDTKNLGAFHAPGRFFMVVGLGHHLRSYLNTVGADAVITITNPTDLPDHVTRALAGFLA